MPSWRRRPNRWSLGDQSERKTAQTCYLRGGLLENRPGSSLGTLVALTAVKPIYECGANQNCELGGAGHGYINRTRAKNS